MLQAEDRWAIAEILSLHGHIFDGGDLDRLDEIFTPEIVYDMSAVGIGAFEGLEAVRSAAAGMGDRGPIAHHVTNVVIHSDEDAPWRRRQDEFCFEPVTSRSPPLCAMAAPGLR